MASHYAHLKGGVKHFFKLFLLIPYNIVIATTEQECIANAMPTLRELFSLVELF
jgi:hypothetical protein